MAANPKDAVPPRQAKPRATKQAQKTKLEALRALVGELQKEADRRVGARVVVENRWLDDLRQYYGEYTTQIQKDLTDAAKSTLFINQTRPKTNAMEARLSDMLFPTDDRNWGIQPTPVPELTVKAEQTAKASAAATMASVQNPDHPGLAAASLAAQRDAALVEATMDEARSRANAMQEEIDDHLRECNYSIHARDVIRDSCKLGTGIMKGPITDGSSRRAWQAMNPDGTPMPKQPMGSPAPSTVDYALTYEPDDRPVYWRVDPWNYFPDMDASNHDEGESDYERHLFNKKQMRALARKRGFSQDGIRRLLDAGPTKGAPAYLANLRAITGQNQTVVSDRYQVWEYHGPLEVNQIELLAEFLGRDGDLEDLPQDVDPLDEVQVVVWFCQGEPLKFGLHHLDSGDSIYSVFNLERDDSSIFGFGIPYIMRDPQKALAASWRTVMDNMGLSSGPQIVINDDVIEPADGDWTLRPRKVWRRKSGAPADQKPFEIFEISSHLTELMEVVETSRKNIDEETALPMLAQGEQGAQVTKTFQGMAILMNSVNVVFRRIVKNWDDGLTTPAITRLYDWLMQFSTKDYIKGDYKVDARGTSVLLVREMQSQNIMLFLNNYVGHPIMGKFMKKDGLPGLRKLSQTLMIPADELIKSDTEVEQDEALAAKKQPPPNIEMQKLVTQMNMAKDHDQTLRDVAYINRETQLMIWAQKANMSLDQLRNELQIAFDDRQSKERIFAGEAAIEAKLAREDAAKGEKPAGSGGYISQ